MNQSDPLVACLNCQFSTNKGEAELYAHSRVHQFDPNYLIKCFRCVTVSKKYNSHLVHMKSCKKTFEKKNSKQNTVEPMGPIEREKKIIWQCLNLNCDVQLEVSGEPNLKDFEAVASHCYTHKDNVPPCPNCGRKYEVKKFEFISIQKSIIESWLVFRLL